MQVSYFEIAAFADSPFAGNPAGVCLLDAWLPDPVLQAIAANNNLAETAFLLPQAPGPLPLRWFTPTVEMDLCGHATVAAAHALWQHRGWSGDRVRFMSRSGELAVGRADGWLELDFPARPGAPSAAPDDLVAGLGKQPREVLRARDWMAVFDTAAEVIALRPDFPRLARLDGLGVIATAPGEESDFVSRFFAPAGGVDEDPVTGSSHCTLIPYWSRRLGKARLEARQVSTRGGRLRCEDRGARVGIAGQAVTYLEGTIRLP